MPELARGDRDVVVLTVLALLLTGPRHTYEMHRMMIDTHKTFVTGLPRSMYHAVERLQKDKLIVVVETRRDGPGPERTVYALTDAGRADLRERVGKLLRTPDPDSTLFVAALSFVGCLSTGQARDALAERSALLRSAVDGQTAALADVGKKINRLLLIELEYERARHVAEKDWVDGILGDLDNGTLTWPDDITDLVVDLHAGE